MLQMRKVDAQVHAGLPALRSSILQVMQRRTVGLVLASRDLEAFVDSQIGRVRSERESRAEDDLSSIAHLFHTCQ